MSVGKLSLVLTITILFVMLFISTTSVLDTNAQKFKPIKPPNIIKKPPGSLTKHTKSGTTELSFKKFDTVKPFYKPEFSPVIEKYIHKNMKELNNDLFTSLATRIIAFLPYLIS